MAYNMELHRIFRVHPISIIPCIQICEATDGRFWYEPCHTQTGLYPCGVPVMAEKYWEKPVIFLFRSREADGNSRRTVIFWQILWDLFTYEKAVEEKVLQ